MTKRKPERHSPSQTGVLPTHIAGADQFEMVSHGPVERPAAAVVRIARPGRMSARERRDIAGWLRWHAAHLLAHGKDYTAGTFNGRFVYRR